jgi:hypothetical protein
MPPPADSSTWPLSRGSGCCGFIRTCSDTYVTTMLDAGVSLRDVQIAARHADPCTTVRYDRARKNLDRHPDAHPAGWSYGQAGRRVGPWG